jgi:hypothetical protein
VAAGGGVSNGKRPAFQFYPKDWREDLALQSCSLAAQGLWINMMCLMHAGTPYGHLAVNGHPMADADASRLLGVSLAEYRRLVKELETKGVPGRDSGEVLFSRRMVRDEHIRAVRASSGSLGGQATKDRFAQANPPANGTANGHQSAQQSVAAATADAGAVVWKEGAGGNHEAEVRESLPPDSRDAFEGMLRAAHSPIALVNELHKIGTGHQIHGATWTHLGAALRDLVLTGNGRPSGRAIRSFVQTAMAEASAPSNGIKLPKVQVDEYAAASAKFRAEGR